MDHLTSAARVDAGGTWLGAVGALVIAGTMAAVAGPFGLGVGALVLGAWYFIPGPVAVAVGLVLSLVVLPMSADRWSIATISIGCLVVLASPMAAEPLRASLLTTALMGAGLSAIAWVGWSAWQPRWLVGLALIVLVGLALYGIHRYQVVSLGRRGVEPLA